MKNYLSKEKTSLLRTKSIITATEIVYEIADLMVAQCVESGATRALDRTSVDFVISESQNKKRVLKG